MHYSSEKNLRHDLTPKVDETLEPSVIRSDQTETEKTERPPEEVTEVETISVASIPLAVGIF